MPGKSLRRDGATSPAAQRRPSVLAQPKPCRRGNSFAPRKRNQGDPHKIEDFAGRPLRRVVPEEKGKDAW